MYPVRRPSPFVLVSTNHGSMIVNRNDFCQAPNGGLYGVGYQLLETSSFDQSEVDFALALLERRQHFYGDGLVAIDCGANIGVHTIEWARLMTNWGTVYSFEAQQPIFYALAGNVALNNCLNVVAKHCAVGAECGAIDIVLPDYNVPASYGSLELRQTERSEFIGQELSAANVHSVPMISIDALALPRLDFLKIDVEGMEVDVLLGASNTIQQSHPIIICEVIKSDRDRINQLLEGKGYQCFPMGINILAVHATDPVLTLVNCVNGVLSLDVPGE